MNLLQSKIISIITLGLGSVLAGLLPAWFANQSRQQWPLLLSILLCFGGGVLLSTSMVHMLPELRESAPKGYEQYSELVFCLGFFILYLLDEIVHYFYGETIETIEIHETTPEVSNIRNRRHSASTRYSYGAIEQKDSLVSKERESSNNPSFYRARSESVLFLDGVPSQLTHVGHQEPCHTTPTANIGLLIALTIHALLEGLVVGLEKLPGKVLLLLGAIASHKLVVGFCLGLELASNQANTFCRHLVCIIIFTLGTVGGITIGIFVSNVSSETTNIIIPLLQGLAGGTLLYVTLSEVLPRERARWRQKHYKKQAGIFQFLSFGFGFALLTIISKFLD